jgi:hypothetical protein
VDGAVDGAAEVGRTRAPGGEASPDVTGVRRLQNRRALA